MASEAEKAKTLELQQRIDELQRQANASNPAGKSYDSTWLQGVGKDTQTGKQYASWLKSTASAKASLPSVQTEYNTLISNPELAKFASEHPATQYEVRRYSTGQTGYDPASQPDRARNKADIDVRRDAMIFDIARSNPSYSIKQIDQAYNERSGALLPQNVTINYEATLAARQQGLNVGSAVYNNLPETYQKEWDKQFGERNKIISLTESFGGDRPKTQTDYLVSLTEGGITTPSNKNYFVGLSEGARANGYTTHYTIELTEGGQKKRVRAENQDEILKQFKANQANLKGFIDQSKKIGATRISIFDESGKLIKESKIDRAFFDIAKSSRVGTVSLKAGGDPIEKTIGFSQDKEGKITTTKIQGEQFKTGLFIEQNKIIETQDGKRTITPITEWSKGLEADAEARRREPKDPFSSTIKTLSTMSKSKNPFIAASSGFFAEVTSGFGGLVNLSNIAYEKAIGIKSSREKVFGELLLNQTQTNQTKTSQPQAVTLPSIQQDIKTAETAPSNVVGAIAGAGMAAYEYKNVKALSGIGEAITGYGQALYKSPAKTIGESIGFVFPVGTSAAKAIPLRLERTALEGASASARSLAIGYGLKTKQVISFTSEGKFVFGKPKFENPITIEATTQKQIKRGVKLAADSNPITQKTFTNLDTLEKVKGVTPEVLERARNINAIIEIGSKSKDPVKRGFGEQPFESIRPEETKSLLKSFESQQKRLTGRLGGIEGSTSQTPFVLDPYVRMSGDFDFHLKKFKTAEARAKQTAKEITPFGDRSFEANINLKQKSAHVDLLEQGKNKGKVGEFLNEEQIDEFGELESISGNTLFGKAIPEGTKKIEGLKTFSLQRQLLKKGESIFSLQKTESGEFKLEPFAPRKPKDVSDFYAIAETKAVNLLLAGREKEALELGREISQFKKNFAEIDIHKYFETKSGDTVLNEGKSIIDKITDNPEPILKTGIAGTKAPRFTEDEATEKPRRQTNEFESMVTQSKALKEKSLSLFTKALDLKESALSVGRTRINFDSSISSSSSKFEKSILSKGSIQSRSLNQGVTSRSQSIISRSESVISIPNKSVFGSYGGSSTGRSAPSLTSKSSSSSTGRSTPSFTGKSTPSITGRSAPSLTYSLTSKSEIITPSRTVRIPEGFRITTKQTEKKRRESEEASLKDFLGSTHQSQVESFRTVKTDISYGDVKTARLAAKDISLTNKIHNRKAFSVTKSNSFLGNKPKKIKF